jgi:hypothetical protein
MSFMGPEEGGVVAVSRIPGPSLVGIFAVGASPSKGRGKGVEGNGKGGYSGT